MENLLSKVSEAKKTSLYSDMCGLLESLTKEDFNTKYEDFKVKYVDEKTVLTYVATGWAGLGCTWL